MADLALARRVLAAALDKTGVRHDATSPEVIAVHANLAPLFPAGGLKPGTVVSIYGSTTLLLAVLATPMQAGTWLAVVGRTDLGLLAAAEWGIDLDHVALIPAPGTESALVVAALLDGVDLVVIGPHALLTDTDRRRLAARARERGTVLISQQPWPGADVVLQAGALDWDGMNAGQGYLTSVVLRIKRSGRGPAAVPMQRDLRFGSDIFALAPLRDQLREVGAARSAASHGTPAPSRRRGLELVG